MPKLTTFAEVNEVLLRVQPRAVTGRVVYSLDHVVELMAYIGDPQEKLKIIHVAGTSGKTSTAYYAAGLLHAAGYKVGLSVSPHVDQVNERLQIDMVPLAEAEFCSEFGTFMDLVEQSEIKTTYFELLVAFTYWEYARQQVDYAVVEVGLGGLMDATNVVMRADKVCVLTDIGLDHVAVLGKTIPEIAAQKAGIIQLHNAAFCYDQGPDVLDQFRARARQKQADLHILDQQALPSDFDFLPLFQKRNFGLSLAAVTFTLQRDSHPALTDEQKMQAAHTYVPGRMDTHTLANGKIFIMDAAHNGQKLHALGESLRAQYPGQEIAAIVGFIMSSDGRLELAVREVVDIAHHIIVTDFSGSEQDIAHEARGQVEIVAALQDVGFTNYQVAPNLADAYALLQARPEPVLLATGSIYMLGALRALLKGKQ
ncbi:MAG TPA: Mur ligase family protein [Patescibacteria group bacterium]|nr:Mur ligase family protein [Patescibacteria group bacterium]